MSEAFRTFERNQVLFKRFPKTNDFNANDIEKALKLFESGFCYPLEARDEEGRRVLIIQPARFDTNIFTAEDGMRLLTYILTILIEEEETQIAGLITITDYANATMKQVIPPNLLIDLLEITAKAAPVKQKGNYNLNLPTFAQFVIEIAKSLMSEKLRKRVVVLKNPKDLKDFFNVSILPSHFGGASTEAEMMKAFIQLRDQKIETVNNMWNQQQSLDNLPVDFLWNGSADDLGSFRKLEVD